MELAWRKQVGSFVAELDVRVQPSSTWLTFEKASTYSDDFSPATVLSCAGTLESLEN
tara:strand:- start:1243 stop:1413 length:171 start_codon:yes stop_codon:yes gene_type:complete